MEQATSLESPDTVCLGGLSGREFYTAKQGSQIIPILPVNSWVWGV